MFNLTAIEAIKNDLKIQELTKKIELLEENLKKLQELKDRVKGSKSNNKTEIKGE